jgi:hypothetical protein
MEECPEKPSEVIFYWNSKGTVYLGAHFRDLFVKNVC